MNDQERPWLKSFDPGVDPDLPIPERSFSDLVEETFDTFRGKPAYHFMGVTKTFDDLDKDTLRFVRFLNEIGCGPGDVVGINMPNIPQYFIAHLGVLRAGCSVTGVSPLLSPKEMKYQLNDSGAKVLVTLDALFEHRFKKIADAVPALTHVVTTSIADYLPALTGMLGKLLRKIPSGKVTPLTDKTVLSFREVMRQHEPATSTPSPDPEDTALIYYTGGTTGPAKGAELTHRNMVATAVLMPNWSDLTPGQEIFCSGAPFFHIAGLMVGMTALCMGAEQVLVPDPRNTRLITKQIARHKATVLFNVPSLYQLLAQDPGFRALGQEAFDRIKICASGAAPFPPDSLRELESLVGEGKVIEIYGMTETTAILTANPRYGEHKIGSVGLPGQNMMVKLVDLDTGTKEVPLGEEGEVIVSGPQVTKGYLNKPNETAHALRQFQGRTYLYTGDVGRMDDQGYLFLVDRAKDMIIVSGFKVFSTEAETTLCDHPAVMRCAVVGTPNPERPGSELVKAVIQPTPGYNGSDLGKLEQEILSYCRENMAPYKVPKIVEFVDEIPLTPIGKVDKKALRTVSAVASN